MRRFIRFVLAQELEFLIIAIPLWIGMCAPAFVGQIRAEPRQHIAASTANTVTVSEAIVAKGNRGSTTGRQWISTISRVRMLAKKEVPRAVYALNTPAEPPRPRRSTAYTRKRRVERTTRHCSPSKAFSQHGRRWYHH